MSLLCRSASSQKAKAPPRGRGSVRGEPPPGGSWGSGGRTAPRACKGEASRDGGRTWGHRDDKDGPHDAAGRACPGGKSCGVEGGGCTGENQLPGGARAARAEETGWGAHREPQGSSPRGWWQLEEMPAVGAAPSPVASRGGAGGGGLSGGRGQPALAPPVRLPKGSVQLLQL